MDFLASPLLYGLTGEHSVWTYLFIVLVLTQPTIFSVTLYLHRSMTHKGVEFHPAVSHFCRFWLWLTTGMKTYEWVSVHRKHHARCELPDDPHSPMQQKNGVWDVLLHGVALYRKAAVLRSTLRYVTGPGAVGLPNDWLERNVYTKYNWLGLQILLAIHLVLFGLPGLLIWIMEFFWIPFWAAGVINGVGHWFGYRNADTLNGDGSGPDSSTNIVPFGLWIGGEELHNNHHAYPTSAKFSQKWYEVDIGWGAIRVLEFFRLCKVKHVAYRPSVSKQKTSESDLFKLFQEHRHYLMSQFRLVAKKEAEHAHDLLERLQQLVRARGVDAVTPTQLYQWLEDVERSGRKRLIAFSEWLQRLEGRVPKRYRTRGA